MITKIIERLESFEKENGIKILYAVESGSRAWGFASLTSDYDVRFLYVKPLDSYLSIDEGRDVLESIEEDGLLDFSGWDLKKTLKLFRKSNPALMEWIHSPIVYLDRYGLSDKLRKLMVLQFNATVAVHHYLHMSERNFKEYLNSERVRVKKYFYVLRPIFACLWILKHQTQPPVPYSELYSDMVLPSYLKAEIDKLYHLRVSLKEDEYIDKSEIVNEYIIREFSHLKEQEKNFPVVYDTSESLNIIFRQTLHDVWNV